MLPLVALLVLPAVPPAPTVIVCEPFDNVFVPDKNPPPPPPPPPKPLPPPPPPTIRYSTINESSKTCNVEVPVFVKV